MKQLSIGKLQKWKSHKIVRAIQVDHFIACEDCVKLYVDNGLDRVEILAKPDLFDRSLPPAGERFYFVVYEDGYQSWSPTDAFEDGYSPIR